MSDLGLLFTVYNIPLLEVELELVNFQIFDIFFLHLLVVTTKSPLESSTIWELTVWKFIIQCISLYLAFLYCFVLGKCIKFILQ